MVDLISRWSDALTVVSVGANASPPDVAGLKLSVLGQTAMLSWPSAGPLAAGYDLRYSPLTTGASWEAMTKFGTTAGTSYQGKAKDGTYAVKARSYKGRLSDHAALAVLTGTEIVGTNVVEVLTTSGTWPGTKTNVIVEAGELRLTYGGDVFAPANFFGQADFFAPGGQSLFAASGTYTVPGSVNLGAVYTSRITASVQARGSNAARNFFAYSDVFAQDDWFGFGAGDWDAHVEIRTTQVDPALNVWSAWQELDAGDITAYAMQFRLVLQSLSPGVTPKVTSLAITIDMPDRIVAGKDIAVGTSGVTIAFAPPFKVLRGISIAAQDLASGDRPVITAKTREGFTILFRDSANNPVARTFDYTAVGYGASR